MVYLWEWIRLSKKEFINYVKFFKSVRGEVCIDGKEGLYDYFKVFNCRVFFYIFKNERGKFDLMIK